jgi:hypothetical protein
MLPDPDQVSQTIALSNERDLWQKLADQAFRRGYSLGRDQGFTDGYAQCEADEAAAWHAIIAPMAYPERYEAQRLRNAEAFSRREADDHERTFAARAWATPSHLRTPVQASCVHAYPPPNNARAP